jgi:oligopeptide transport system permease protein
MTGYVVRRALGLVPLLWAVATVTFVLMHAVPGGPFSTDERPLPDATVEALERKYGLDESALGQYRTFMANLVRGDLGLSFQQNRSVTTILSERAGPTVQLGLYAFVFAVVVGSVAGVISAVHRNRWPDYAGVAFTTVAAGVPGFVIAVVLVIVFALELGWADVLGWEAANPRKFVLPTIALGLLPAAYLGRIIRAALIEALGQDYVRTARAKGLAERHVLFRHAARNAMIPVLTVSGPILAGLVTGSFIIEQVFEIPGIGRAFVRAVQTRDYGMIMGATLLYAAVIAVLNLAVDVLYGVVDPRTRVAPR